MKRTRFPRALAGALLVALVSTNPVRACPGDCDSDGSVTVAELVAAVAMAMHRAPLDCRHLDLDGDGIAGVAELVAAVRSAIRGCSTPAPVPTSSVTATAMGGRTPTPTATSTVLMPTPSPTAPATPTPTLGCMVSLDPTEIDVPGCPTNPDDLRGTFELGVTEQHCCWMLFSAGGGVALMPQEGCGNATIKFSVRPNPLPNPGSELVRVAVEPDGDVDTLSIRQSRSCTRTPDPRLRPTATPTGRR
jgi:hypothetical protein